MPTTKPGSCKWRDRLAEHAASLRGARFSLGAEAEERCARSSRRRASSCKVNLRANWNESEVKFWDALDYIGVLAYFPLTKSTNPSASEIAAAWEKRCRELEKFSKQNGKQFLFAEIGYNESARAAAEPWGFKTGGDHAAEIQERCIDIALGLPAKHQFIAGMYWWKWFPEVPDDEQENYRLQTAPIKALIAKHWKAER